MAGLNTFTRGIKLALRQGRPVKQVANPTCLANLGSRICPRTLTGQCRLHTRSGSFDSEASSRSPWKQQLNSHRHDAVRAYRGRFTAIDTSTVGAEPGGYFTRSDTKFDHQQQDGQIDIKIIDYSDKDIQQNEISSATALQDFLQSNPNPSWSACRWIYVNGLNPEILQCLGINKRLHRLTIEDVLDTSTPTKVDWYDDHCFMEMTLQKLVQLHHDQPNRDGHIRSQSSFSGEEPDLLELMERRKNWRTLSHGEFGVSVEQVSLFLTSDNTVITIFERSGQDVLNPILKRLQSSQTIIRSSNDPSMLIQAVIDAVVDLSLPIGKAVSEAFSRLEFSVLTNPSIQQSKQLYLLRSGLTLLMDNINAADGLIRTLIDHRAVQLPTANPNSVRILMDKRVT